MNGISYNDIRTMNVKTAPSISSRIDSHLQTSEDNAEWLQRGGAHLWLVMVMKLDRLSRLI